MTSNSGFERFLPGVHLRQRDAGQPLLSQPQSAGIKIAAFQIEFREPIPHSREHEARTAADLEKACRAWKVTPENRLTQPIPRAEPEVAGFKRLKRREIIGRETVVVFGGLRGEGQKSEGLSRLPPTFRTAPDGSGKWFPASETELHRAFFPRCNDLIFICFDVGESGLSAVSPRSVRLDSIKDAE